VSLFYAFAHIYIGLGKRTKKNLSTQS